MSLLQETVQALHHKDARDCTSQELFAALSEIARARASALPRLMGERRLYYISAEFLIGRLLATNLLNLGLYDALDAELAPLGTSVAALTELEPEPSLGNGGLGRLAACFLDSIATLGLPGDGIGLNYHLGLFRQRFEGRMQREEPNPWIAPGGWLRREAFSCPVQFGSVTVTATLYDIDVVGQAGGAGRLHLFDLDSVDEGIVGDGIAFDKEDIEKNLTLFLYPDDSDEQGRLLRVYQQYFMVSCAAQLILAGEDAAGHDMRKLHEHVAIQINDTHPSMVIPELVRLLTARGLSFEEAAAIVEKTCAYTNHTILAEALETWPMAYIERVAPQLVEILRALDRRARERHGDEALAIIDAHGSVHMARLAIHYGFSVNGVAALHTKILEKETLAPFYAVYPERFNNKTNGITFRRWLMRSNPALAELVTELIGDGWQRDATQLEGLLAFAEDDAVLDRILAIKAENKRALSRHLLTAQGINLHSEAIFDMQVKRIHEYKRQQMNALYAIYKYKRIKEGHLPKTPITMLFGGKAAPAYVLAKDIIHLILCLQELTRRDEDVRPWLQVVMPENYNVSLAEQMIPACDISEQISLASKEASGTGNMKFMLNGALTLGTLDGANVEIHELVGDDNIFLFGKTSEEVIELYRTQGYHAADYYRGDELIEEAVDFLISDTLRKIGDTHSLDRLYKELVSKDWFMSLLDLRSYIEKKDWMLGEYENRRGWARKMLVNTAKAGFFSSDRTIAQYNEDIWHLTPVGGKEGEQA